MVLGQPFEDRLAQAREDRVAGDPREPDVEGHVGAQEAGIVSRPGLRLHEPAQVRDVLVRRRLRCHARNADLEEGASRLQVLQMLGRAADQMSRALLDLVDDVLGRGREHPGALAVADRDEPGPLQGLHGLGARPACRSDARASARVRTAACRQAATPHQEYVRSGPWRPPRTACAWERRRPLRRLPPMSPVDARERSTSRFATAPASPVHWIDAPVADVADVGDVGDMGDALRRYVTDAAGRATRRASRVRIRTASRACAGPVGCQASVRRAGSPRRRRSATEARWGKGARDGLAPIGLGTVRRAGSRSGLCPTRSSTAASAMSAGTAWRSCAVSRRRSAMPRGERRSRATSWRTTASRPRAPIIATRQA